MSRSLGGYSCIPTCNDATWYSGSSPFNLSNNENHSTPPQQRDEFEVKYSTAPLPSSSYRTCPNSRGVASHSDGYPAYSHPRQMPASLRDTLKIILEEELCATLPPLPLQLLNRLPEELRIDFLTSLIAQGISTTPNVTDNSDDNLTSTATPPSIYIPPAIHLTLLTTLLCHPTFTTEEAEWERWAEGYGLR